MDGQPVDTESAGSGYAVSTRAIPTLGDVQHRNQELRSTQNFKSFRRPDRQLHFRTIRAILHRNCDAKGRP